MDVDVLVMLLVVALLQAYYTFWKRLDTRTVLPPSSWLVWLRRLWLLLSGLGAAFFGLSLAYESSEWVAASRGVICLSVLLIQIYTAAFMAYGPLLHEKYAIRWAVGLSGTVVLALAAFVVPGVVLRDADGPHGVLWGAFGVGSSVISISSTYARSKMLTRRGVLTVVAVVNGICVATSAVLTGLSAGEILTYWSFAAQSTPPMAAIILQTWGSDVWKHLKTLAVGGWHLVTKPAVFSTCLDTNRNADARNWSARLTASQASCNGPSSDWGRESYEMADDRGCGNEQRDAREIV